MCLGDLYTYKFEKGQLYFVYFYFFIVRALEPSLVFTSALPHGACIGFHHEEFSFSRAMITS
jgi:hypothetical protein